MMVAVVGDDLCSINYAGENFEMLATDPLYLKNHQHNDPTTNVSKISPS